MLRLRREEPPVRSCSEPVRQQFAVRMLRTDRSRRVHGERTLARDDERASERASESRSLRDQFVEIKVRHEKKQ